MHNQGQRIGLEKSYREHMHIGTPWCFGSFFGLTCIGCHVSAIIYLGVLEIKYRSKEVFMTDFITFMRNRRA